MSQSVKCNACGQMSTEADYCSNCGTQLTADAPDSGTPAATPGSPAASPTHGHETCPKCSAEREDSTSPFCGTCGYNFVTKQGGDVVAADVPPPAPAPVNTTSAPVATSASQVGPRMDITITVDFSVATAPTVRPSLSFPLFDEESLIGRKSGSVKQTVAIEDDAISKRHALIVRNHDGSFLIRDLNSTNGTNVNGTALVAGADQSLKEGDVIRMGEFTIITVQTIRHS
jgi:hypothetical protein